MTLEHQNSINFQVHKRFFYFIRETKSAKKCVQKIRSSLVYLVSLVFSMYVLCVSCKYWDKDYWKVVGRWKESCVVLSKCGLREREEEKKEGDEE